MPIKAVRFKFVIYKYPSFLELQSAFYCTIVAGMNTGQLVESGIW